MEDPEAAVEGQVASRKIRKGFNDAGWEIEPENYSRFITQIDPDKYDQAYWAIGAEDGYTTETAREARFGRGFRVKSNKNAIYLDVNDKLANANPRKSTISVTYFDSGDGEFSIYYDSSSDSNRLLAKVKVRNSRKWITTSFEAAEIRFRNKGPNKSDISLINTGKKDVKFHMVEIDY